MRSQPPPRPIKVRRHQEDGQIQEWLEPVSPDLAALTPALNQAAIDRASLVYATTLRQSETLRLELQSALNQVRREQALPLVEQLQWVAGAAAFASPVPSLDLLAAVAINGQLIMDLGRVYGFQFSLEEAKTAAATLASLTVKLGLVELSTQALTTVLKSHAATYVAGGLVQGLSAAYLTRLAGLSLIEHFEAAALAGQTAPTLSLEGLGQRLQALFQQNSQGALLRLVQQGLERLRPAPATQPALPAQV
ncbi:MAG: YcjF family protein [Cyanobacteria bacterium Co-bin13]|nr:YcjF family protein [Cyanobacteria bacterium Co-bin13]